MLAKERQASAGLHKELAADCKVDGGLRSRLAAHHKADAGFHKSWLLTARRRLLFARSSLLLKVPAAPVFLVKHALADKDPAVDARDSAADVRDSGVDVKVDERDSEADVRASGVDVRACEADVRASGLQRVSATSTLSPSKTTSK